MTLNAAIERDIALLLEPGESLASKTVAAGRIAGVLEDASAALEGLFAYIDHGDLRGESFESVYERAVAVERALGWLEDE